MDNDIEKVYRSINNRLESTAKYGTCHKYDLDRLYRDLSKVELLSSIYAKVAFVKAIYSNLCNGSYDVKR